MYTPQQFLDAAKEAEVSLIDAQHIIDVMVKMNEHPEIGMFRKMKENSMLFKKGEVVEIINVDPTDEYCKYRLRNIHGVTSWTDNERHEPTTETF